MQSLIGKNFGLKGLSLQASGLAFIEMLKKTNRVSRNGKFSVENEYSFLNSDESNN